MAGENTPTTLNGFFKEVYGDDILNLVPESSKLVKIVPFVPSEKETGNKYHQPVILANEQGFTYAAYDAGAFALNEQIALAMKDAQVSPSQILLRSAISYDAAARASKSSKAFAKTMTLVVENMLESMSKRVEISCLYGGTGLGKCHASVNGGATTTVIEILSSSWATGIWAGAEGAKLDIYAAAVKQNANAALVISAVDVATHKITVTGNGVDIGVIDAAIAGSPDTLDLFFFGAKGNEMTGLDGIITNAGSLFNIDAAVYALWKGNSYAAGGAALTMGKILSGTALGVQRGLNEDATVLLNPASWTNVMSDLAALRRLDGSYNRKKGENGMESIEFYSVNGKLEIHSHNIVKQGEAFIFPHKKTKRIGAQDISFKTPGREEEIFLQLANAAGYEIRNYTDQAIFLEAPARAVKITGIVNA
jgi:hypothetical protein